MNSLPASTVAELIGLTLRQLRYLAKVGLVEPSVRSGAGRGAEALYAPEDLLALMIVKYIRDTCGTEFPTERLRELLRVVAQRAGAGQTLVIDGKGYWIEDGSLDAILRRSITATFCDLGALADELDIRLKRAGLPRARSSQLAAA